MRAWARAACWAAGLTTAVVPLAVAGCSFQSSEERAAEQVVTTFFDRLVDGDATGAGELLSDPSVLSPVALDDAVYAEAVRPVEARVTSVTGSGPESSVDVEYRLDGEEETRTLVVSTETAGGEPRVALWSDHGLPVVHPGGPVEIVVEGSGGVARAP